MRTRCSIYSDTNKNKIDDQLEQKAEIFCDQMLTRLKFTSGDKKFHIEHGQEFSTLTLLVMRIFNNKEKLLRRLTKPGEVFTLAKIWHSKKNMELI